MQDEQTMKEKRNQELRTERQLLLPKPEDKATITFSLFLHRLCRVILPSGRISPPLLQGCRITTYQDEEGHWHQDKTRYLIDINNIEWNRGGRI